jgi:hypothetical protein
VALSSQKKETYKKQQNLEPLIVQGSVYISP